MDLTAILKNPQKYGFDLDNRDGKIFLGLLDGHLIGVKDDRHVTLCCGTRAGKTVSVLAPMLLAGPRNRSFVVIDPKGELADLSALFQAQALGKWVGLLDPFGQTHPALKDYRVSYNPMSILTESSPTLAEDAGLLADAMVMAQGGHEAHWDESAKTLIEGLLLHVATYPAYEGRRNLVTVRKLLMTIGKALACEMEDNEAADGIVQGAASDFFERPENERMGVLSTTRRHTKFLDYRAVQEALSDPADPERRFQLTDLKTRDGGMALFVALPVGRIATSCNRMFRMIVGLALEAMEREQRKDNETFIILDEFANAVGHMRSIEVGAGLVAGMGCKLVFVLQGLQQLQALYKDNWETMLANSSLQIFYGNADLTTTEYIAKRCGQTTVWTETQAQAPMAQRTDTAAGRSRSPQVSDLITAGEAARLFDRDDRLRRMLVLWAGQEPIVLQRTRYYEDEPFSSRYSRWE